MSICYCGAQAGYPHDKYCPFPLYREDPIQSPKWLKDNLNLRELLNVQEPQPKSFYAARWIVNNFCHVGMLDEEVVEYMKWRFEEYDPDTPDDVRQEVYKAALEAHHKNQAVYRDTQRGYQP